MQGAETKRVRVRGRARLRSGFLAAAGVLVLVCACTHDWDRYNPGNRQALVEDAGEDAGEEEAGVDAASDGAPIVVDNLRCPSRDRGPTLVGIPADNGGYCIDATEVTKAQYKAFLDTSPPTSGQGQQCAGNVSYTPPGGWPPTAADEDHPVAFVDWCDAVAFCKWSGKRICGLIGGGDYTPDLASDVKSSEWFNACSFNETRKYPYGDTYSPQYCNGNGFSAEAGAAPAGSIASCEGSVRGLFDMSGNVFEWDGACIVDPTVPSNSKCSYRGGGFRSREGEMACRPSERFGIFEFFPTLGFRCCSDLEAPDADAGADGGPKDASADG